MLDELKEHIKMNIIYPFQNPSLFRTYGKKIGGGILMFGPPGCGKTFIARATAGECSARFITIAINDILDMWIGNSEKNLHEVFELARRNTPAVLFIDELDAIGGSRQQMRFHHSRMLTSQLLSELDGISSNNDEILVLGATNSPWFVDASLRRPGRFDRILFVPPPDLKARIEILQLHLKGKPLETIDYERVARGMEKYSGYSLTDLGSTNGTFVHEQQLAPHLPHLLQGGDRIRIGDMVFLYEAGRPDFQSPLVQKSSHNDVPTAKVSAIELRALSQSELFGY